MTMPNKPKLPQATSRYLRGLWSSKDLVASGYPSLWTVYVPTPQWSQGEATADRTAQHHGVARTNRTRTEEQRQQDLERITKYRSLEDQIREQAKQESNHASPELFALTTKLLRLNPEYYTIWNVRRRYLISGSLSKRSGGSSRSRASPSSLASGITTESSEACSPSTSDATPRAPTSRVVPLSGRSGTTAEAGSAENLEKDETAAEASTDAGVNEETTEQAEATTQSDPKKDKDEDPEELSKQIESDTQTLQSELSFTIPLLIDYPKCYWIWHYRVWLLSQSVARLPTETARAIWTAELGLCSKMLTKDRRNYHAWGYRRNVVTMLESAQLGGSSMAEHEFEYTTRMIRADLSNFSAWHSRAGLIVRLLDERGADDATRRGMLEDELDLVRDGLNVGPEDSSLWFYHQFLMGQLMDLDTDKSGAIAPALTLEERVKYVEREIADIRDLLEDYDDMKGIYEALLRYTTGLMALKGGSRDEGLSKEIRTWLAKLRTLDPMRKGRWDDVEKMLNEIQ